MHDPCKRQQRRPYPQHEHTTCLLCVWCAAVSVSCGVASWNQRHAADGGSGGDGAAFVDDIFDGGTSGRGQREERRTGKDLVCIFEGSEILADYRAFILPECGGDECDGMACDIL